MYYLDFSSLITTIVMIIMTVNYWVNSQKPTQKGKTNGSKSTVQFTIKL